MQIRMLVDAKNEVLLQQYAWLDNFKYTSETVQEGMYMIRYMQYCCLVSAKVAIVPNWFLHHRAPGSTQRSGPHLLPYSDGTFPKYIVCGESPVTNDNRDDQSNSTFYDNPGGLDAHLVYWKQIFGLISDSFRSIVHVAVYDPIWLWHTAIPRTGHKSIGVQSLEALNLAISSYSVDE